MTEAGFQYFIRRSLAAAALFLVLGVSSCSNSESGEHASRAAGQSESVSNFNFGTLQTGMVLAHTFELVNDSPEDVAVINVQSTCGCTVAAIEKKYIAAGGAVDLDVEVNTMGKSGALKSSVLVSLSDGTAKEFSLAGRVYTPVLPALEFVEKPGINSDSRGFFVTWPIDRDLSVVVSELDRSLFGVSVNPVPQMRMTSVRVWRLFSSPFGPFESTLKLTTDNPEEPRFEIPIRGYLPYPLEVRHRSIAVGSVPRGSFATASTEILVASAKPVSVNFVKHIKGKAGAWRLNYNEGNSATFEFDVYAPEDPSEPVAATSLVVGLAIEGYEREVTLDAVGIVVD